MVIPKQRIIKGIIMLFSFVFIDQLIKYSIRFFQPNIDLLVLKIVFLKNTGIAFSFFTGYNFFLTIIGSVFVILSFYFYKYLVDEFGYYAFILIVAGAISNLIDRIFLGYVVDMISVWKFPVFNIADSMITIGAILVIIKYGREELNKKK